jgi:carboxylesterase type B
MPSGQAVQGLASSTGFQFLGIPFAQPPVGTLRFVDAQPVSPIPGVFNATQYGAACPQNCELPPHTCPPLIAEDCLSLNIYTPSLTPSRLLPVMFYIHGGNFKQGYGGGPLYDSSNLANATDTVFVTINYVRAVDLYIVVCMQSIQFHEYFVSASWCIVFLGWFRSGWPASRQLWYH